MTSRATSKRRESVLDRPGRRGWLHGSAWFILLLAVLELCWLCWFLVVPLPNFPRESGTLRRGLLLLKAFPEVVPGTSWGESLVGQAARELSHVENLPERLPIAGAAALIVLAALGLGELVLAGCRFRAGLRPAERLAVGYGIGTTGLGVLALLAGRGGLLDPWIFRIGLSAIALAGLGVSRFWRLRVVRGRARHRCAFASSDHRPVPGHHAAGGHAAGDRLRRAGVSPPGAEGVFPGGADLVLAT